MPKGEGPEIDNGEDFELLFTVPAAEADPLQAQWTEATRVTKIGTMQPGTKMYLLDESGQRLPLKPEGFSHR
ncbi:hypothetical protein C5Y96_11365 [Blastopirellula marina]|uniref:PurM-like C-terminal domain-containing protein n=1 Tax=Blastopirellula marina TaxID=124 RepID=A0A2S8FMM1_9BACT|nr:MULTISPECIES: hypothetical protein [Pirellulaceae]PQO33435.1 hypothetical protein C5Y96_11365 [Blastopirellula marina]RCS52525.1 hypothetical protein DTL36_11375 [Bremerella cremea]